MNSEIKRIGLYLSDSYLAADLKDQFAETGHLLKVCYDDNGLLYYLVSFAPHVIIVTEQCVSDLLAELETIDLERIQLKPNILLFGDSRRANLLPIKSILESRITQGSISMENIVDKCAALLTPTLANENSTSNENDADQISRYEEVVSTTRHDLANKILIIEGTLRRLKKEGKVSEEDKEYKNMQDAVSSIKACIQDLKNLKNLKKDAA